MSRASIIFAAIALSSCATTQTWSQYYPDQTVVFDPQSVAWARGDGNNTIRGNAVMRTVGGEVRTCAGTQAGVIPVSPYSSERMVMVFGSTERGFRPAERTMQFAVSPPGYSDVNRQVTCDSQGDFLIDRLPDGEYFVISTVVWGVPSGYITMTQGGALMQRVRLTGGETRRVVLTN